MVAASIYLSLPEPGSHGAASHGARCHRSAGREASFSSAPSCVQPCAQHALARAALCHLLLPILEHSGVHACTAARRSFSLSSILDLLWRLRLLGQLVFLCDSSGRRCCSGCSGGAAWHRERTTRKVQLRCSGVERIRGLCRREQNPVRSAPDDASRAQKYRVRVTLEVKHLCVFNS